MNADYVRYELNLSRILIKAINKRKPAYIPPADPLKMEQAMSYMTSTAGDQERDKLTYFEIESKWGRNGYSHYLIRQYNENPVVVTLKHEDDYFNWVAGVLAVRLRSQAQPLL